MYGGHTKPRMLWPARYLLLPPIPLSREHPRCECDIRLVVLESTASIVEKKNRSELSVLTDDTLAIDVWVDLAAQQEWNVAQNDRVSDGHGQGVNDFKRKSRRSSRRAVIGTSAFWSKWSGWRISPTS